MKIALALLLLCGCNGGGIDPSSAGNPQNGVYFVTNTLAENDCQPAPVQVTNVQSMVSSTEKGMNVPLPLGGGRFRRVDVDGSAAAVSFTVCGAVQSWLLEVVSHDDSALLVRRTTNWTVAAVDRGCDGAADVPAADCSTVDQLSYRLKEPCPCNAFILNGDEVTCGCR